MTRVKDIITDIYNKFIQKVKEIFTSKRKLRVAILLIILLLADIILGLISRHIIGLMPEQHEASRWSDDGKSAQVSVFFSEDQAITEDSIKRLVYEIDQKLVEAGVTNNDADDEIDKKDSPSNIIDTQPLGQEEEKDQEEPKEEDTGISSLYTTCYSAQGYVDISFENRKAEKVKTIGIGGDFFLFHPLELVRGAYISGDDLMKDGIIVDEDLAWNLFGSIDIVGQQVTIDDIPHYVKGVVKRPGGRMNKAAGLSESYAYISLDSLAKYGTILSGRTQEEAEEEGAYTSGLTGGINCFEIVCPSPVEGIAAKAVKESTGLDDAHVTVIDNTTRFKNLSLAKIIFKVGTRSMWDKAIFYPYWENIARGYEDILAMLLFVRFLCVATIVIIIAVLIVKAYKNKKWNLELIINKLSDMKYDFDVKRKMKKDSKVKESGE
ncbi:ABC transporter permease [Butyrivibrio proteoclasticus]|uniref:ABC transporter permease n=1 Tax=Butyrivibrio proteoclasticus TaxID=43305 RepID=UPI00047EDDC5|nr:ABC transporter permease [Butyrivibrio proteoclasticus]